MQHTIFPFIFSLFIIQNSIAQPAIIWEKEYGGSKFDWGASVIRTSDGHWLFAGISTSPDGDVPGHTGGFDTWDPWVFKTDTTGAIAWSKNFGGSSQEEGGAVAENPDGSYWVVGETHSFDGIFAANKGKWDIYVLKISASGDLLLNKTFGGSGADDFNGSVPTADGGLVFLASTWSGSGSGDLIFNHGERDCWIVKLDADAQIEWQRSIGGSKHESGSTLLASKNGGYWLLVNSQSSDGDFPVLDGTKDTWLLRLDDLGNILWKQRLGLPDEMTSFSAAEDAGGNVVVLERFAGNDRLALEIVAPDGSLVLEKDLGHIFLPGSYWHGFRPDAGGGFYFFGANLAHDGFLTRTNSNLEVSWQHTFQSAGSKFPLEVMPLEDNSLLVFGVVTTDSVITFDYEQDVQVWVAKMGGTSGVADLADKPVLQLFPNPLPAGEPLRMLLDNNFTGRVKIEILSLDGHVLQTYFREKTTVSTIEDFNVSNVAGVFFVRVSDEKTSVSRLVLRF